MSTIRLFCKCKLILQILLSQKGVFGDFGLIPTCNLTPPFCALCRQFSPQHWSSCSQNALQEAFELGMDYCLRNPPRTIFDGPVCGNGFLEEGEECDCGMAKVRGWAGVRMLCMAMQKWGMGLLNLDFFLFVFYLFFSSSVHPDQF